jgi:ATP-dependent helicase HepA
MKRASTSRPFREGDRVLHRFNRELGPGVIESVTESRMTVRFPRSGETLQFSTAASPFVPLLLPPGADPERWLENFQDDMIERLARLEVDDLPDFFNRLEALRLRKLREAEGLGSFLGGRIEIFPHQLHVAQAATATDPVRWLLADEVGLGKTVEACLILNHLVATRRVERVLVVAPRSLVVQWLGELYRKFHQVFVLIDADRRQDVLKEKGPGFNPFDVYEKGVVALEDLVEQAHVARLAAAAAPDLLVVDEAHRLRRRRGTAGSATYRAVAPLIEKSRHALLLTATPLEADAYEFFRLLELLRPREYGSWEEFHRSLEEGHSLAPCTSATRRADIGGLPPRVPRPVVLPPWPEREAAELAALSEIAEEAPENAPHRENLERLLAEPTGAEDLRILWLGREARRWQKRGEKALVFVAEKPALLVLKRELEYHLSRRVGIFHEELSPARRDLEVARFAEPDGPPLLIATECGGEGRNFQFARRLVLFDLPWDPLLVEQRIGRLDRINRRLPVEIVYFRPARGFGAEVAALYEALGIFEEPLGGLERSLGHVQAAIQEAAAGPGGNLNIDAIVAETRQVREMIRRATYRHLHRNRYRPELAPGILARIPPDLEKRTAAVVLEACRRFGFEREPKRGRATWYLEFGPEATVDTLHGVAPGNRWLGTFSREEAVAKESLDFFAAGHPLVEGILAELADGTRGQVALFEIQGTGREGIGVLVATRRGGEFEIRAFDLEGELQAAWPETILSPGADLVQLPPSQWPLSGWPDRIRELFARLELPGELAAIAGVRLRR